MKMKLSLLNPKYEATYEEAMQLPGDMKQYNLAKKIIKQGKRLGKRVFSAPVKNSKELRYAKFTIVTHPEPYQERTWFSIPIPYMKNDHGIGFY